MTNRSRRAPLTGIRILDFGQVFSLPYGGGLLADLGAEVIRIEAPHRLDNRGNGSQAIDNKAGDRPWNRGTTFQVLNRGKRSLVLDMSQQKGRDLFRQLVAVSDIVMENFTPRVMHNWGLHYEALAEINPRIIMLSNCGYGGSGPWSPLPIQGTALEATMGIVAYTGFEGSPPSKVGQSYPDFLASWTAAFSILVALRDLRETGTGQWIDQSMYQLGVGTVPEPMLQTQLDGIELQRQGNHHEWKSPSNLYRAQGEDRWLAISVDSDAKWRLLLQIMGRGDLEADDRFITVAQRRANNAEVDEIVGAWTARQDPFEATRLLQAEGIAAGPMMNSRDLMLDEHLEHRRFYEAVDFGPEAGLRPLIGRPYKMRNTPLHIQAGAPDFADANRYVAKDILGLSDAEVEALYAEGVLIDEPVNPPPIPTGPARSNTAVNEDPDYRQKMERWLERRMPSAVIDVTTK